MSDPFAGFVLGFLGVGEGLPLQQSGFAGQPKWISRPHQDPGRGVSSRESFDLAALQAVCRIGVFPRPDSSALQYESVNCMVGRSCHEAGLGGRFQKTGVDYTVTS